MPSLIQHHQGQRNTGGAFLLPPNPPGHTALATAGSRDTNPTAQNTHRNEARKQVGSERYFRWARLWVTSNLMDVILPEEGGLRWKFGCSRQGPSPAVPHVAGGSVPLPSPTALPQGCPSSWGRVCRVYPLLTQEPATATQLRGASQRKLLYITEEVLSWDHARQKGAIGRECKKHHQERV